MSGNVHPTPGPIFPCSVCTGNVTWRGKSVQCCACSKWVHLRCSQLSLSKFRALGSSHSWSCPSGRTTVTPSSDSSDMYTSTVQSSPASANAALSPHPRLLTYYPRYAHSISSPSAPLHRPLLLAFLLCHLPPLPLTFSGFFNGMLVVSVPGALNYFIFSRPILSTLSAFRNPILTPLPLSGFSALRSDRTHSRSGILSSDTTHASGGAIIFVRQGLSFSKLSTSSLSSLDSYSDYVGVNIFLNNSPSLSFLNVYIPLFAPPQRMAEPIPSLPPPEISSFWDTSIAITPFGTQEVLPTPARRKYLTGSSPLTSSPSNDPDTPTLLHRSSPDISFAPSSLALSCSWEVLQNLGSDHLPILLSIPLSLRSFVPTSAPLPSIFRKLAEMALPPTLTLTVLQQRNTRLFLFPLLLLSLPIWH